MPADKDYLEYVMDFFTDFDGVSSRAMFGGYGIFHYDKMFALIAGSRLYFKVGDSNIGSFERAGSPQFKPCLITRSLPTCLRKTIPSGSGHWPR